MLFLLGNLVMLVAGAAGLNWDWRCSYKKGIAWLGLMKMIPD
jgi:hypothetical protein